MKNDPQTKAFLASSGHEFNGAELSAYTPQKQAVASEMGMVWPWSKPGDAVSFDVTVAIPRDELKDMPKKDRPADGMRTVTVGHYRQSFKDSVIALWLCSQTQGRVDRAERKPEEAMTEAWVWARKIGLNQNSELSGSALMVWIQITNEIAASKGEAAVKGEKGGAENDLGEC